MVWKIKLVKNPGNNQVLCKLENQMCYTFLDEI